MLPEFVPRVAAMHPPVMGKGVHTIYWGCLKYHQLHPNEAPKGQRRLPVAPQALQSAHGPRLVDRSPPCLVVIGWSQVWNRVLQGQL